MSMSLVRRAALLTTATVIVGAPFEVYAQQAAEPAPLPQITVEAAKKKVAVAAKKKSAPSATKAKAAPPPAAEPAVVEPFDATATSEGTGPAADAQGDVGYNATRTGTATKTDTPLRNVPQSISVITDKQIKDQNIKSIGEATKYVPGVTTGTGEGNRDQISIRGQNTTADFFVDGVRDDAQIFRDLYNAERLEVLKGPNALTFGRGGGGGIVNRVTKRAEFFNLNEGTISVGSYGYKRATADTNYVVNPNFAVRMNGMYEYSDSFRDDVNLERWAVNPTFTFRLSERTRVQVGYEHFEDNRTADRGIPSFNGRPADTSKSTFFGNPDRSYADANVDSVFATVEHRTDFGLKVRNHTLYANYDKFYQNVYASGPVSNTNTVPIQAYNNLNDRENIFNQTDLTYKIDMGIMRHTLLGGMEFGRQEGRNFRQNGFFSGVATTINVPFGSPNISTPNIVFRGVANQTNNAVEADVQSFYVQDQVEITRYLELIGGVRFDRFELDVENFNAAPGTANRNFNREDNLTSPRAGIIIKPTDYLSAYGSYTVSYLPSSGDQFGNLNSLSVTLEPEKFTNYEIGAKWDITPALSLAVAHYWLTRENTPFALTPDVTIQTGETQVEGTEVTLTGYITDQWQVAAGYAHQKGEITSQTAPNVVVGTDLPFLPSDTFSLWNRFQFNPMWGVGVGVVHRTDMFAALSTVTLPGPPISLGRQATIVPEYTTVDAAIYFKLNENLRAQLNVENILGEDYFLSAHSNDNIAPGAPTTAYFSITSNF